jgi:hypothetical protein
MRQVKGSRQKAKGVVEVLKKIFVKGERVDASVSILSSMLDPSLLPLPFHLSPEGMGGTPWRGCF